MHHPAVATSPYMVAAAPPAPPPTRSPRPGPWARALGPLAFVAAALGVAAPARADIYRYEDKDGVIHFSNVNKRGKLYARDRGGRKPAAAPSPISAAAAAAPGATPSEYDDYIREAASLYQIPEALVRAVIRVESNFDPRAISRANARGLMQLIPATAERMLVTDPFDARQNVLGGTRYLRVLANLFNGNLQLTLAAYNAGENAVIRYRGIPPYEETQAYVSRVLSFYNLYRGKPPS
ncbi:MAG TPA: lytic transglycosylase domain-containing protein [Polyangiaceae bacterium]|nr:lytic transglycosylase domain-containing protein [Polyangiaceae bacterium]